MKSIQKFLRIEFLVFILFLLIISFVLDIPTTYFPAKAIDSAQNSFINSSTTLDNSYSKDETSKIVEKKLTAIIENGPRTSSNPYDYVENSKDFEELVSLGKPVADYMINEMSKSNANTLKEHIMAIVCTKILRLKLDTTNGIDGRGWYYKFGTFYKYNDNTAPSTFEQQIVNSEGKIVDRFPNAVNYSDIEQVVSKAILDTEIKGYMLGEFPTEAHKLLKTEEKDGKVFAYVIKQFSFFGFEDEKFTVVSGSGAIPAVVELKRLPNGEFSFENLRNPLDGAGYSESIKEMLPLELHKVALNIDKKISNELWDIQVSKAKQYLHAIGREDASIVRHVEKNWTDEQKSKALYNINLMRHDFPEWEGSKESLVSIGGKTGALARVKYETKVETIANNEYIVTLIKTWDIKVGNKQPISWWKYEYKDGQVKLVDHEDNDGVVAIIK